jgi:hypothetical protein
MGSVPNRTGTFASHEGGVYGEPDSARPDQFPIASIDRTTGEQPAGGVTRHLRR